MYAYFDRFQLKITKEQALSGSHQGRCDDDIKALLTVPQIRNQFNKIKPDDIKAELKEYGAWDDDKLTDVEQNKARILWIACVNIREDLTRCQ